MAMKPKTRVHRRANITTERVMAFLFARDITFSSIEVATSIRERSYSRWSAAFSWSLSHTAALSALFPISRCPLSDPLPIPCLFHGHHEPHDKFLSKTSNRIGGQ